MGKQRSTQAQAAAMIRKELRSNDINASVTSSSGTVNVWLMDCSPGTRKSVESYVERFKSGHFCGHQDMYVYSSRNSDIPQVRFVFVEPVWSDELNSAALDYAENNHESCGEIQGRFDMGCGAREIARSILHGGMCQDFWTSRKPRQRVS